MYHIDREREREIKIYVKELTHLTVESSKFKAQRTGWQTGNSRIIIATLESTGESEG